MYLLLPASNFWILAFVYINIEISFYVLVTLIPNYECKCLPTPPPPQWHPPPPKNWEMAASRLPPSPSPSLHNRESLQPYRSLTSAFITTRLYVATTGYNLCTLNKCIHLSMLYVRHRKYHTIKYPHTDNNNFITYDNTSCMKSEEMFTD